MRVYLASSRAFSSNFNSSEFFQEAIHVMKVANKAGKYMNKTEFQEHTKVNFDSRLLESAYLG